VRVSRRGAVPILMQTPSPQPLRKGRGGIHRKGARPFALLQSLGRSAKSKCTIATSTAMFEERSIKRIGSVLCSPSSTTTRPRRQGHGSSVFFGGGTPSLMAAGGTAAALIDRIAARWDLVPLPRSPSKRAKPDLGRGGAASGTSAPPASIVLARVRALDPQALPSSAAATM